MQTSKPALELLTSDAIYRENPTALFHQLCGARPATLLLESADIDSKDDLKSLLLVDSALRITALGDTVTIQALSANGGRAAGTAGRRAALRDRQSAPAPTAAS
ncbi:anthranilate synthase [Klebsiella aerogenes]|nr:anthranilate synthase [Klebsiella aerogenes]